MSDSWSDSAGAGSGSTDTVLLVGQVPLPGALRPFSPSGLLSLEIQVDPDTGIVKNAGCRELSPSAEALLNELLVGEEMESAWAGCVAALGQRYFAPNRESLIQALEMVRRQFRQWRQSTATIAAASPPAAAPPLPAEPYRPSPNAQSSRRNTRHQLATVLVTLLAHSRLLDGHDGANRGSQAVGAETRRQAVQLYAVLHQILHSVQSEKGLLEPKIEPIAIPTVVQRALRRSQLLGRQVPLEQRLPADLPPARGDALVLEEALVLLFDEVAAHAAAAGTAVEITAERRKSELQLTLALNARGETPSESAGEADPPDEADPLAQLWAGGLGTLAARTLVEHQGGRLWMQDHFPQGNHILCVALPTHGVPEDAEKQSPNRRPEPPASLRKTTRITPEWR
ncbi:MAG: DUF3870 domain-containing protein [Chloroflexota bacterium]